jgi:hypothetical protein
MEIGVTLHVSGVIISGLLCSITSFFEEQAEVIRRLGSVENAEARQGFAELYDWHADQTQTQPAIEPAEDGQAAETEEAGADLPDFIHLRAASVHAPGTDAVLPETLWRGRLDHVSGWSIAPTGPSRHLAAERLPSGYSHSTVAWRGRLVMPSSVALLVLEPSDPAVSLL